MKKKLAVILVLIFLVLASFTAFSFFEQPSVSVSAANTDWPQLQGNAGHSGYVPQNLVPPYTKLWQVYHPFPISYRVQPIIAQNLIFLPSNDGNLYTLSSTDGHQVWGFPTGGALVNSAGYDSGKVFVGSTDNYIYALNATDGTLAWKYQTGSTVKTAPIIAAGKVFMGSSDGFMYALNTADGTLDWKSDTKAPIYDTAAYDNGKLFFGGMNAKAYALDAANGTILWSVQLWGQGFRDRWTVAGNGKVFFTPVLIGDYHLALQDGTFLFSSGGLSGYPVIYNKPWATQKTTILNYLTANPTKKALYVFNQDGTTPFTPPVLYVSGGAQSEHSAPVLLPNGNVNVMYRRSFGEVAKYGPTTNDAIYVGELNLSTGDILQVDRCVLGGGGWNNCGNYKGAFTSDESSSLVRSGEILYLDVARGTGGLDTRNSVRVSPSVARYNTDGGFADALVFYNDYVPQGPCNTGGGWRLSFCSLPSELNSDGNDLKRPTPIVNDTFYILHSNTLTAVKGVLRP